MIGIWFDIEARGDEDGDEDGDKDGGENGGDKDGGRKGQACDGRKDDVSFQDVRPQDCADCRFRGLATAKAISGDVDRAEDFGHAAERRQGLPMANLYERLFGGGKANGAEQRMDNARRGISRNQ